MEISGKVIRFYRKMLKLTQREGGCDKLASSRMERDVQLVGRKTAFKMSRMFRISVGNLIV